MRPPTGSQSLPTLCGSEVQRRDRRRAGREHYQQSHEPKFEHAANGTCAAGCGCWPARRAPACGPASHTNIGPGIERGRGAKRLCGSCYPWGRPYARPACRVGAKSHQQGLTFGTCRRWNRRVRSHPMNTSSRKDIQRRSQCRLFRHLRAWSVTAAAGVGSKKFTSH